MRSSSFRRVGCAALALGLVATGVVTLDNPLPAAARVLVVPSPNPTNTGFVTLRGVDCVHPTDCFAVGNFQQNFTGIDKTFVQHWDGAKWSIVDSPAPAGESHSGFFDIACTSSTFCVAVGSSSPVPDDDNDAPINTVVEHWDGATWREVPTPRFPLGSHTNFPYRFLMGVACTSSVSCFAVGYSTNGGGYRTLVLRWDGNTWAIVPSPNRPAPFGGPQVLSSVACTSSTNCFAVGNAHIGNNAGTISRDVTLVERWNGKSWTILPSPNPVPNAHAPMGNALESIACTASKSCVATGHYGTYDPDGRPRTLTLVERWNGSAWKIVPSPTPGGDRRRNQLSSVACTSSTSCLAVGSDESVGASTTLMERWNGTKWSIVPTPTFAGPQFISLNAVTCEKTFCFAVGHRFVFHGDYTTLIERYS